MKRLLPIILAEILLLTACGTAHSSGEGKNQTTPALKIYSDVDFAASSFKHTNNGGVTEDPILPYNIDAICGATMTVEGPAVVTSIPLSVRELENRTEGLVRGDYADERGVFLYEGLDLWYLLNGMVEGDKGILLTDTAFRVKIKNANRADVASFTLAEITAAHEANRPILLAYGIGDADGNTAPFVFDARSEGEHSLGYISALDNEDGCIKLVYDLETYGENAGSRRFSNAAYVYVCEETEPGFRHSDDTTGTFNTSRYLDYILSFRGEALGREYDLTVRELESLVAFGEGGALIEGGIGHSDFYSLANNAYWYVNEYEGLDLYKLLLYLGMDDADTMGLKAARTTLVRFLAADGAVANESFSVDALSYPDAFGFYNKNAADTGDGSYASTNADLVRTGFPVLLSYGVNRYPYTILKTDDAYVSGLSNSGGPLRVVFGKTQYNHANGSNQVQYLSEVIAGRDVLYNTHRYTENAAQAALADETVHFAVNGTDGSVLIDRSLTVGEIEALIYGDGIGAAEKKAARVKDHYEREGENDIYEGVDLTYLLMNVLGLPGTNGTVTFSDGEKTLSLSLQELFADGYNAALSRDGGRSILAFAKNGSPMVAGVSDAGYVDSVKLRPFLETDPEVYNVANDGGPLCVLIPSSSPDSSDARSLDHVTEITVDLVPDAYAHIEAPFSALAGKSVNFGGEGLESERSFTVAELESRQTETKTFDFSFLTESGESYEGRYRGIALYDLFTEIGIRSNAGDVTVTCADGSRETFPLSWLKKNYVNFITPDKAEVCAMLAYGIGEVGGDPMTGAPLVENKGDKGYDEALGNDGGVLKLIVPQRSADEVNTSCCLKNVVSVEVSANDVDTWSHSMSDVYEEFLDDTFTLTIKNDANEWTHDFTLRELESFRDVIVRARYSVLDIGECEGLDMWKLIRKFAGNVPGMDAPVSITAYADDGYKNDIFSVVYLDGFTKGVETADGERLPVLLCYAINGYPNVDDEGHAGYTGLAGNTAGPLRCVVEGTQGASVKYCVKLVVTLSGSDPIDITVDPALFAEG